MKEIGVRGLLDELLDAHLAGTRRWPLVDRVLAAARRAPQRLTREELLAALAPTNVVGLMNLLIRRRVLVERVERRRLVLFVSERRTKPKG